MLKIGIVLIGILLVLVNVDGEKENPGEVLPNCTTFMMKMAKKQIKLFGECSKELRAVVADHTEFGDKIQCVVKCVLDKGGMLNEEKKVTRKSMQEFMDKHVPELFHAVSHELLEHCIDEFGPKMDHKEELCTVYGEYVSCVQEVVANIC